MAKIAAPTVYCHADHSEWGPGLIVEENPSKVYLHFIEGGRRVFQNAPKFRDRLVRAELTADATAEVIVQITKFQVKAVAKAANAKKPKKVKLPAAVEPDSVEAEEADQPAEHEEE